jgi:hypothetical protein
MLVPAEDAISRIRLDEAKRTPLVREAWPRTRIPTRFRVLAADDQKGYDPQGFFSNEQIWTIMLVVAAF